MFFLSLNSVLDLVSVDVSSRWLLALLLSLNVVKLGYFARCYTALQSELFLI